jgi:hypothetical protein
MLFHGCPPETVGYPRMQTILMTGFYASPEAVLRTITILDITYRHVFYLKLNSIGLSLPHRKHIFLLLTQQVNAIYRFVTMVY